MSANQVIFIMGVSGTGKSTIGQLLADQLHLPFFDGDDYQPLSNINKMKDGIPLEDSDRLGWLIELNKLAKQELCKNGCIIACSALKQTYRDLLTKSIEKESYWIFLHGCFEIIEKRITSRQDHFMKNNLLKSQFETLEEPLYGIKIDVNNSIDKIVHTAIDLLNSMS